MEVGRGLALFQAAILWQVYALTRSPVELGVVGLVRLVPMLAYRRPRALVFAQVAPVLGALANAVGHRPEQDTVLLLLGLLNASEVLQRGRFGAQPRRGGPGRGGRAGVADTRVANVPRP